MLVGFDHLLPVLVPSFVLKTGQQSFWEQSFHLLSCYSLLGHLGAEKQAAGTLTCGHLKTVLQVGVWWTQVGFCLSLFLHFLILTFFSVGFGVVPSSFSSYYFYLPSFSVAIVATWQTEVTCFSRHRLLREMSAILIYCHQLMCCLMHGR